MKDAQKHMNSIVKRIRACGCVLMLDFDGTLAPIVSDHREAYMSFQTRKLLQNAARRFPAAVISGRSLRDVRERVHLPIAYAGSHGLELYSRGTRTGLCAGVPGTTISILQDATRALGEVARAHAGVEIENKTLSYAAHYRSLSPAEARLFVEEALAALKGFVRPGGIRALNDTYTLDIMPDIARTKGHAARVFSRSLRRSSSCVPIYIGDGSTDEDAFRALPDGMTIRVGKSLTSAAKYYFKTRAGVDKFLREVASQRAPIYI